MELMLIRHGQTVGNIHGRYSGSTDEPLSDEGIAQARARSYPAVKLVYVSPLSRAQDTARILFPQSEFQVVEALAEMCFGVFEGRTADEMAEDAAYRAWVDSYCLDACPGGESTAGFAERVLGALTQVLADAQMRQLERIAVVAHGGTQMALMSHLVPDEKQHAYQWIAKNCCGYKLELDAATGPSPASLLHWQPIDGLGDGADADNEPLQRLLAGRPL